MTVLMRLSAAALSLLLLDGSAASLRAQSLAELAKKEEERRKEVKEPSKTYTNKDLTSVPPATAAPPVETAKPAEAEAGSADAAKAKEGDKKDAGPDKGDKSKGPVKDQAYWAGRVKDLQTQLDRDQTFADALQTKINALTTDFVNRDDAAQRAQIARDKQKALDELARLQQAIQNDKKASADLEEEARRAGVPPGWLR